MSDNSNPSSGPDSKVPDSGVGPLLEGTRRRRRPVVIAIVVIIFLGLAGGAWWLFIEPADSETEVEPVVLSTATVRRQDFLETTTLDGTIEFEDPVTASSPGSGFVASVSSEATVVRRGDVIAVVAEDVTDSEVLAAQQRVISARSGVDNATSQYRNVVEEASQAELAAAEVALTRATEALEELQEPVSETELVAARAELERAEDAYEALLDGADATQIAAAELAVTRAGTNVEQARLSLDLLLVDLEAAQSAYCAMPEVPVDVCDEDDLPLSTSERSLLVTAIGDLTSAGDTLSVTTTQTFLSTDTDYRNAEVDHEAARVSLDQAQDALADLESAPTSAELNRTLADLYAAQDRLAALEDGPSDLDLAAAEAERLAAEELLADLQQGAPSASVAAASSSLEASRINLQLAQQDLTALLSGPDVLVVFYGSTQSWRTLSVGVDPGSDINLLETNLLALGFDDGGGLVVDDTFDESTTRAVQSWQESMGVEPTGIVERGAIRYVDGPSQITATLVAVGDQVAMSAPVVELTPIERVVDRVTGDTVTETVETTQRIGTRLEVSDRDILDVGTEVTVELPDDSVIDATVLSIGEVAVLETQQGGGSVSYVEVILTPAESVDPAWTGADVQIEVVTSLTENALAVPVTALLALQEGGYAVEVVAPDGVLTNLVGVETGAFDDGWVEITGEGLDAGTEVVVP